MLKTSSLHHIPHTNHTARAAHSTRVPGLSPGPLKWILKLTPSPLTRLDQVPDVRRRHVVGECQEHFLDVSRNVDGFTYSMNCALDLDLEHLSQQVQQVDFDHLRERVTVDR